MAYRIGTAARTYPLPVAERCSSCHVERHATPASQLRWARCEDCHSESAWGPSSFGLAAHGQSSFTLTGAHAATPCGACHQDPERGHARFQLALGTQACADCHAADDPHGERFGGLVCETCHGTEAFDELAFDHAEISERPSGCIGCHAPDDPHADQFEGRDCSSCHTTDTYALPTFDHAATRFPLDGAHDDAPCASCHLRDSSGAAELVRYRPLGTGCADCHGVTDEA